MPKQVSDEIVRGPKFSLTHWYNRVVQVVLLALLIVGSLFAYTWCSGNHRKIQQSKEAILGAVNAELAKQGLHEISTISLPDASVLLGVPNVVDFENFLPRDEGQAGGRYVGSVKGQLDRQARTVRLTITLGDGQELETTQEVTLGSEEKKEQEADGESR